MLGCKFFQNATKFITKYRWRRHIPALLLPYWCRHRGTDCTYQNILSAVFSFSASARPRPPLDVMQLADRLEDRKRGKILVKKSGWAFLFLCRFCNFLPEVGKARVVPQSFSKCFCSLIANTVPPHPAKMHRKPDQAHGYHVLPQMFSAGLNNTAKNASRWDFSLRHIWFQSSGYISVVPKCSE